MKSNIKLTARYVVLAFIMYLAYIVTGAEYLLQVKDIDPMILNVSIGAIFGALTLVLKSHFETSPSKD